MPKNHLLSSTWYDALGHLVHQVGGNQFHPLLISVLKQITPFEHAVIIAYPNGSRPLHVYNDLPTEQVSHSLDVYLDRAYLLDPFYMACQEDVREGFYRLRTLAPDQFYSSEYYRTYYKATYLQDEVGILVKVHDRLKVIISLGVRGEKKTLSQTALASLATVLPLVNALCLQHWRRSNLFDSEQANGINSNFPLRETLDLAFSNFGRDHLSERECEIVRLVLKGHSSRSISNLLNISAETVKAHRKHVHSKLEISSHAELFSLFLSSIAIVKVASMEDPLNAYYKQRQL